MIGHGQWTVVDKTAMTWVSGPRCTSGILASAYAVFHALSAGGSPFMGNYQNKKNYSPIFAKNRETNLTFFRDRS